MYWKYLFTGFLRNCFVKFELGLGLVKRSVDVYRLCNFFVLSRSKSELLGHTDT